MSESTPSDDVFAGRVGPRRAPPFGGSKPGPRPSIRDESRRLAALEFDRIDPFPPARHPERA